jgi:hypothetical protein
MFIWKEVLDTQNQQLFDKNLEGLKQAGLETKTKLRMDMGGSMGRGRIEYGSYGVRNKVSYRLFVKKADVDSSRSIIYGRSR